VGAPAVLVANRGEIAVRILRAAAELGMRTVAVHAGDEAGAAHTALSALADEVHALPGSGPAAYLDGAALAALAARTGCGLLHPGYGFLSESGEFARQCAAAGVGFVGPAPEVLDLLGDKTRARDLAVRAGVPVLEGTSGSGDGVEGAGEEGGGLAAARDLLARLRERHGPEAAGLMVKAVGGGGGRGMREVRDPAELAEAWERCASEAAAAFGSAGLYAERLLTGARHIEVQLVGDATGAVARLGDRDCSVQRRHQKLIEIAPAPGLEPALRARLAEAALDVARAAGPVGLATVEFLVAGEEFFFLEANPRLQVEHTVTEEVTGLDLVAAQLRLACGETLADLGLDGPPPPPRGCAIQLRVGATGAGTLTRFDPPTGPGVRVDTAARAGQEVGLRYDPLLAKVVVRAPGGLPQAAERGRRALAELAIEGVPTTAPLLAAVLADPLFTTGRADTGYLTAERERELTGGQDGEPHPAVQDADVLAAPLAGTVLSLDAAPGDRVRAGEQLAVLEAMKMEHVVRAPAAGTVRALRAAVGETVAAGAPLFALVLDGEAGPAAEAEERPDPDAVRPDLALVLARQAALRDAARPEAVDRRHRLGRRTARENLADLCDPGSFAEYGGLAVAAQRRRRSLDDLIAHTPADGMVTGIGTVNAERFGPAASRCVAMSYDYTVLAGTQGYVNHRKTDRMLEIAGRERLPVVLFAEGGGGRPGDTDTTHVAGLDVPTFRGFGRLSGTVPLVGIASGRCFAGNAALLGCCDVVIATPEASIGMGGPAMIEGGGLGVHRPEEVGPLSVQVPNGVVDLTARDDADAVALARRYLSYFQGSLETWEEPDPRLLRHVVPEQRRRAYQVRAAVEGIFDLGSVLELREGFGVGVVTALARLAGRPVGVLASNPLHLGGAIDADAADKAARFLQLCDAFGLPVVSLCDTPGFMVGPDAERTATVRHFARLFVVGANLRVPVAAVVLRKAYGLGAMAMFAGSTQTPVATLAWPSGEFGGMGLEGAVRLGYRRELEAIADPDARRAEYDRLLAELYERGRAVNAAMALEIDDVIDPADTRARLLAALPPATSTGTPPPGRSFVDTW